jgi:hypothetical protein
VATVGADCDVIISGGGIKAPLIFVPDSRAEYEVSTGVSSDPDLLILHETVKVFVRSSDYLVRPDGAAYTLSRLEVGALIEALLTAAASDARFSIRTYIGLGLPLVTDAALLGIEEQIFPAYDDYLIAFVRRPTFERGLTLNAVLLTLGERVLTLGDA